MLSLHDNMHSMIQTFGNKLTENLYHGKPSKETRQFPSLLHRPAIRKLTQIEAATQLQTLNIPPGNRLEALKGKWDGYYSIRINEQWRICFQWQEGDAYQVQIIDYHT